MKPGSDLRATLAALLIALVAPCSLMLTPPAQAQQREVGAYPAITGFNVDEVRQLAPGVELSFDLWGTPGGMATLRIDGATRNLHLTEVEPGQYSGIYTIGAHDRIVPSSAVSANLRVGNRVATAMLAESLQRGPERRRGDLAAAPKVERFDVRAIDDLGPGNDLSFTVLGTPGAKVEVTIAGTRGIFFLPEVRPGEYRGTYRIRSADRIAPDSMVTATIRHDGRYASVNLGRPLLVARATSAPRVARYCSNCATVAAVNVIEVSGDGGYLGTIGGAVVGGLIGSSVGGGTGRTAATAAGAVGGALAGNNIERNSRRHLRYEVVVRYDNGATQTLQYENDPGFRVGDPVKVNGGVLVRD
ncbi:glycine zipper 2TM domain-containing protein [Massilia horti]|uniref:Glycine zipper 2TM domain-containing protein n=1 Tax=Massilia horti TaxID=2562153 RepID=A0A4Y9SYJ3_9BURK|nr:glycine zipper 2TM domain-containing protein [Massilia horti]TFW31918.1 glycine zipper 2TM domain-containing protein [Massilia horti]